MKNRLKLIPLCLTLAIAAVPMVKAQSESNDAAKPAHERGPGGPGGRRGPTIEMLAEQLGLSAEQKEKIAPIMKQQREDEQAIRKDDSLSREQKMEKAKAAREETQKAITALLTPDQAKKFAEMRARGPRGDGDRPSKGEKGDKGDKPADK
jgi:Spy/CpxP family protein refolding chaperone